MADGCLRLHLTSVSYALRYNLKNRFKCWPYFSMACSFTSSSFCRAITAKMIFRSSSVRWLRSGRSGMDGGTVGGRGPPWGPTEADIFSTTTVPPSPPPPPPTGSSRRVVSADRFPRRTSRMVPRAEQQRQPRIKQAAAHGCRHLQLCFCVELPLGVSPFSPSLLLHSERISIFYVLPPALRICR